MIENLLTFTVTESGRKSCHSAAMRLWRRAATSEAKELKAQVDRCDPKDIVAWSKDSLEQEGYPWLFANFVCEALSRLRYERLPDLLRLWLPPILNSEIREARSLTVVRSRLQDAADWDRRYPVALMSTVEPDVLARTTKDADAVDCECLLLLGSLRDTKYARLEELLRLLPDTLVKGLGLSGNPSA